MKQIKSLLVSRTLASFLLVGIMSIVLEGGAMSKDLHTTLHFVMPFSIETYIPITMESVENDSYEVWIMKDHKAAKELIQALQLRPSHKAIHEKEIRFKADFGSSGGIFFLDKEGIVLRKNDGLHFELSEKQLEHVEHLLQDMIGVVDVRAYDRFHGKEKVLGTTPGINPKGKD